MDVGSFATEPEYPTSVILAADIDDFLPEDQIGQVPRFPNPFRHPLRAIGWMVRVGFGLASLTLLLAVIAAIPLVNFLALGYLLEVEGRMGRTGKLRYAFPLLGWAPRFGSIVVGLAAWLFPLSLLAGAAADAEVIAPGGLIARRLAALKLVAVVLVTGHLLLALARGGSLGCFVRPLKNLTWLIGRLRRGDYWETAEAHVREFIAGMRLKHHFWLGIRGYAGAMVWLAAPTALLAVLKQTDQGGQVVLTLLGGVQLMIVFAWVPFLQARFATENRWRAMFELGAIRELFCRSPFFWLTAVVLIYTLALPMYLFKIASPPRDAMWGLTLVFIASIYPARVLTGWAYHRAAVRTRRAWFGWRWICRTAMLPLLFMYVFLLFFTQTFGEHGKLVLFEHHAFLLPSPF